MGTGVGENRIMRRLNLVASVALAAAVVALVGCAPPGTVPVGSGTFPPSPVPTLSPSPAPSPTESGAVTVPRCGSKRVLVTAGPVEAGLGHRALVLTLTNCTAKPYKVNGYPTVSILGADRRPLPIAVKHASSYFAIDPGPSSLTLRQGETALSVVAWSATVTYGDPSVGRYISAAPSKQDEWATYPEYFDLGTTGAVSVTAWCRHLPE